MDDTLRWKRLEGLACLAAVVVIWVTSSELIQHILDDLSFYKPFFLTFYNTSLFSIYLIGFLIFPSWRRDPTKPRPLSQSQAELPDQWDSIADMEGSFLSRESNATSTSIVDEGRMLSPREVAKLSALFAPWWFSANLAFNASLCVACGTGTSVASNTVLSSTSLFFTLMFSVVVLSEPATILKFLCVALSFVGVVLITGVDDSYNTTVQGDALSLLSAVLFSVYSVLLKHLMPRHDKVNMPMFFGFLGLINAITCIPLLFLLDHTGLETLEPIPNKVLICLTVNGVVGTVLSDLLWARAVVLTSPLTVNVGMGLTLPLSFIADRFNPFNPAKRAPLRWQWVVGASLVFSSFVLVMSSEAADVTQQAGGDGSSDVSSPEENGTQMHTDDKRNGQGGANTSELVSEGEVTEYAASQAYSMLFKPPVEPELEAVLGCSQL